MCTNYNNIYTTESDRYNHYDYILSKYGKNIKLTDPFIILIKQWWESIMKFGNLTYNHTCYDNSIREAHNRIVQNTHDTLKNIIPVIIYDLQQTSNDKSQIYNEAIEKINNQIIKINKELSIKKQECELINIENTKLQDIVKQFNKDLSIKKQECKLVKIEAQTLKEENTKLHNTIKELNEKIDNLINPKPTNILYDFN